MWFRVETKDGYGFHSSPVVLDTYGRDKPELSWYMGRAFAPYVANKPNLRFFVIEEEFFNYFPKECIVELHPEFYRVRVYDEEPPEPCPHDKRQGLVPVEMFDTHTITFTLGEFLSMLGVDIEEDVCYIDYPEWEDTDDVCISEEGN